MKKIILVAAMSVCLIVPMFAMTMTAAHAGSADNLLWGGYEGEVQSESGLGNRDPREIAAAVINILLGFLGIIAVVIVLLGGFKWMTAAGDEGKIDEAKKMISAGVIGLAVILAAFGIAQFVVEALYGATSATG